MLVMYSLDTCMRQILFTDFQVPERFHGDPKFSGIYLIDYIIIVS